MQWNLAIYMCLLTDAGLVGFDSQPLFLSTKEALMLVVKEILNYVLKITLLNANKRGNYGRSFTF